MSSNVDHARNELQEAAASAGRSEQEQLQSIDEGLMEMTEGDKTQDAPIHRDRLAELKEKLDGIRGETSGETERHVTNASAALAEELERLPAGEE